METDMTKTAQRPVETQETNRLISSEKVDGTAVYNGEGQHLGAVDHQMIDKFSGHVEYAVMSFGGFLGMGESYHPLPWRALTYSTNLGGYCVDLDRARLEQSPHYNRGYPPGLGGPSLQKQDRSILDTARLIDGAAGPPQSAAPLTQILVYQRPVGGDANAQQSQKGYARIQEGKLKSGSGRKVKSRKQAVAIAMSESGQSKRRKKAG